jgi:hypothetical protein
VSARRLCAETGRSRAEMSSRLAEKARILRVLFFMNP